MRAEAVKICALAAALTVLAAVQDLSPAVFGAKPPLLLSIGCICGLPAAVCAGLFADALGGFPFGCSVAFFAASAVLARVFRRAALPVSVAAAGLYQVWILLWGCEIPATPAAYSAAAMSLFLHPAMCAAVAAVRVHAGIDAEPGEAAA